MAVEKVEQAGIGFAGSVRRLSEHMAPMDAPQLDAQSSLAICQKAENVATPEEAHDALDEYIPVLGKYRVSHDVVIAVAVLVERLRQREGMLGFWLDVFRLTDGHRTALRICARWYRRTGQFDEGNRFVANSCEQAKSDPYVAASYVMGLAELGDFDRIDRFYEENFLDLDSEEFLLAYAYCLAISGRTSDARSIVLGICGISEPSEEHRAVLKKISEIEAAAGSTVTDDAGAIGKIVRDLAAKRDPEYQTESRGGVVFYTGQLGPGGAERQFTRICKGILRRSGLPPSGRARPLLAPPRVCVRHASPATNSDFFRPELEAAGVAVSVLSEISPPTARFPDGLEPDHQAAFDDLPSDIRDATLKLVPYLKEANPHAIYIWQDGAVLQAALAALLAGVPRIVLSFRGMSPNHRKELLRPQLAPLYEALAETPGVTFSCNSHSASAGYEEWLGLDAQSVRILRNAAEIPSVHSDERDLGIWNNIELASPECTKTVLGVFRFARNKRPREWLEIAAQYCAKHEDTRFVIIGRGAEHEPMQERLSELGLQNRIFLVGTTRHVGFYLSKADLLMHLSKYEGQPNAVIEAQMAGVAVLATPAGGTGEIVEDTETGILLSESNELPMEECASKLEHLLQGPDCLRRMGAKAAAVSSRRFNIDDVIEETLELLT